MVAGNSPPPSPSAPETANYHKVFNLYHNWWCCLRADIILVQETLISQRNAAARSLVEVRLAAAARDYGGPGYTIIWGCNSAGPHGGTATLIRSDWLEEGRLHIINGEVAGVTAATDARLLHLRCRWEGHSFLLANCYLPSGDPTGQAAFLRDRLRPLLEQQGAGGVVMGGDFNFTMDWRQDRCPTPGGTSHRDNTPAILMAELSTKLSLRDVFRHRHPARRCFTFSSRNAASLLDRFFLADALIPFVAQCQVEHGSPESDHRPILLHLRPLTPSAVGPGLAQTRMAFWIDPALQQQFRGHIEEEAGRAPCDDDQALLSWWPGFKRRALGFCRGLDRCYLEARERLSEGEEAARAAFDAALARVEGGTAEGVGQPSNLVQLLDARRAYSSAMATRSRAEERKWRYLQLREGERPSPLLTTLLSPPDSAHKIAGLANPGGGVTTSGMEMASIMARTFAGVSAAQEVDQEAEQQVLDAVARHATPLDTAAAAAAGSPAISWEEVREAATAATDGKSQGADGLPPEFWRRGGDPLFHLLASLFSAIGRTGDTPVGFLHGVVSPIHKDGDVTQPSNYRPITLLNTDYRCLTRALATRVGGILGPALGPEQTAFLKGRLIGDNVTFLHLLPEVLRSNARFRSGPVLGIIAFLDFRKAYDTISRPFLLRVMAATGAGDGLVHWVNTILSGTSAAAKVNGFVSEPFPYEAGVRQGCPLAPLLYLFVAWALLLFLKACPLLGVDLGDKRACAVQFADDIQPFLKSPSLQARRGFIEYMDVFGRASWQRLNTLKSRLLPVGLEGGGGGRGRMQQQEAGGGLQLPVSPSSPLPLPWVPSLPMRPPTSMVDWWTGRSC